MVNKMTKQEAEKEIFRAIEEFRAFAPGFDPSWSDEYKAKMSAVRRLVRQGILKHIPKRPGSWAKYVKS